MNQAFQNIAIFARGQSKGIADTVQSVGLYLTERGYGIWLEKETANLFTDNHFATISAHQLNQHCDLLLVIGGDGSLIKAAHLAAPQNMPVLGINRGRLGFLTDIKPYDFTELEQVLAGNYEEEHRFMLTNELYNNSDAIHADTVVNEIALSRGMVTHMIEFELYINKQFVCHYRADGLITATPTGSTAYALSGGGPIVHPSLNAILMVPMFSHTLTSRPIVIPGNSAIEIRVDSNNETAPCVSCDGQDRVCITPGGHIHIRKADTVLRLIHPKAYNYFETLRTKLHWESTKRR
jgi:NAD+ kinase